MVTPLAWVGRADRDTNNYRDLLAACCLGAGGGEGPIGCSAFVPNCTMTPMAEGTAGAQRLI
jgi:hypothetical protein